MRDFYQKVLQTPVEGDDTSITFSLQGVQLALCSAHRMEAMAAGYTSGAGCGNSVLEFEVEDVDQEYERLKPLAVAFVKPPTTQPWGIRSVWFRDPDGNLVNFYRPAPAGPGDHL